MSPSNVNLGASLKVRCSCDSDLSQLALRVLAAISLVGLVQSVERQ
jgi:hypothetical protein